MDLYDYKYKDQYIFNDIQHHIMKIDTMISDIQSGQMTLPSEFRMEVDNILTYNNNKMYDDRICVSPQQSEKQKTKLEMVSDYSESPDIFTKKVVSNLKRIMSDRNVIGKHWQRDHKELTLDDMKDVIQRIEEIAGEGGDSGGFPYDRLLMLIEQSLCKDKSYIEGEEGFDEHMKQISGQIINIFDKMDRWSEGRDREEYMEIINHINAITEGI